MTDLNTEYPDKESIQEAFDRITARLRNDIMDMELLFKRIIDGRTYISIEDASALLRCSSDELPNKLPKYHVGRNYLYKVSDIIEFVESRKVGGKK